MATTFGIKKTSEDGDDVRVAFQNGMGNGKVNIKFVYPNPERLPDDMIIVPLDNGGDATTVGMVRKIIQAQNEAFLYEQVYNVTEEDDTH